MTARVTVEDVERVAELAHLELTPEETPRMLNDLNAILDQVAELNELDTSGVMPLAQVSELLDAVAGGACCAATFAWPRWTGLRCWRKRRRQTKFFQGAEGD